MPDERMSLNLSDNAALTKLKAVIANFAGVIWSVDRDNNITLFDGLYLKEIGVTPDFIEGKNLDVAKKKSRHLDIIENVDKTFQEGPQDWIADIDGKKFRTRTSLIRDDNGEVSGVVGSTEDVTEIIMLQRELEDTLEKAAVAISDLELAQHTVSAMFESNPHINILFDSSFKVVDCNPAACVFLGFDSKEALVEGFIERVVRSIPEVQSEGRISVPLPERLMTAAKEGECKFETELHINGGIRILDVEFRRIPYANTFAIVGYIADLTEIHERERELIRRDKQLSEAVEEARAANQAKSAFLSTMSHEIRTPMNAILGITEIELQNEAHSRETKEAFSKIYSSGDVLLGIINDILDLSKIEAGKLELVIDKYEIASMISDTAQLNMMRIGSKPIEFELEVDEESPRTLMGDELRIKQILNNILSNAFKYTLSGTVKLTINTEYGPGAGDMVNLVVSVSDTGQGMTKEQLEKLFDEYSRFNVEANRSTEGTGLGMSITRNLISLMDGEIMAESEPGVGTVFTVKIPQKRVGTAMLGKEIVENLRQFRGSGKAQMRRAQISREPMPYGSVLIVDDVETNIYVAKGLLSPYKLEIDSAESGYEAIEKVKNGKTYDIIFMDHMMPKMDGIEATKIIRGMDYALPIVALTANAVAGQADIFLGNGFDDFISKPIDVRQLNTVLNKLIRDKQPPEVIEAARRGAGGDADSSAGGAGKPVVDRKFAEAFVRDASKSLTVLDALFEKGSLVDENDIRTYVIHVHGMKSALANIGEMELSAVALKLEASARDGASGIMVEETAAFLESLRLVVDMLMPDSEVAGAAAAGIAEDLPLFRQKLAEIVAACEEYDESSAEEALGALSDKVWSQAQKAVLDVISEHLLHSDFDEIVAAANAYLEA
ncbi:MAG: ATP-binding protein [Oscillospiraceae bacterium]|nr:ATP-binding protein [Oscillospiraceae bacterium]